MSAQRKTSKREKLTKASSIQQKPQHVVVAEEFETPKGQAVVQLSVKDIKPQCACKRYSGENFHCKAHEPVTECPNCHCIKVELAVNLEEFKELRNYRCTICGVFYSRNMVNGIYNYSP